MTTSPKAPIVLVDALSVAYRSAGREVPVVREVSLEVSPGRTLALVGESGSGKSTVAATLLGHLRHGSRITGGRVTVDGKELGVHDLKPGMKLEKTITTTSTPKVITTVKSVTGKIWQITPPTSVILTLEDGTNQKFNIPKDQKFNVDGQMVDAWGLKKGMKISATKVVEEPMTEVEQQAKVTGQMPPPPPAPPSDAPILIALVTPAPAPAAAAAPAELPKTASFLPLLGLLGMLSTVSSFGLWAIRKIV